MIRAGLLFVQVVKSNVNVGRTGKEWVVVSDFDGSGAEDDDKSSCPDGGGEDVQSIVGTGSRFAPPSSSESVSESDMISTVGGTA